MFSPQKASRANPALPPSQSTFSTNRSPRSDRDASRDASETLPHQRGTRPQPASSVEFASCHCANNAWTPVTRVLENQVGLQSTCDSPSRGTSLAAQPSPARRCGPRFTSIYQRAIHASRLGTPICQTTLVPFSNTPAPFVTQGPKHALGPPTLIRVHLRLSVYLWPIFIYRPPRQPLRTPRCQTTPVPFSDTSASAPPRLCVELTPPSYSHPPGTHSPPRIFHSLRNLD